MPNDSLKLLSKKQRLLNTFERLIPLVDGISDSVRFATLLGGCPIMEIKKQPNKDINQLFQ